MAWPWARDGYLEVENEMMSLPDEGAVIAWAEEHFGTDGQGFLDDGGTGLPAPDQALLADEHQGQVFGAFVADAFRQGVVGYAQDVYVQGRPWPFDPARIAVPVHIVRGELDAIVPAAHSRHMGSVIPGATLRTLPGHGHLTMLSEVPAILSALVHTRDGAGGRSA